MKILVAEDDVSQLRVLEELLVNWGYDVFKAKDGGEAWQILTQEDAPLLAIIDWQMPDVYGSEICRRYREMFGSRPAYFILITGKGSQEDLIAGLEAGADDYITKPFVLEDLRARVQVGVRTIELQKRLGGYAKDLEEEITERKRAEEALQKAHGELEMLVRERTAELMVANRQLQEEIAERKQTEKALRESEARFRDLFENAPICIFEVDFTQTTPTVIQANRQAEKTYGWSSDEFASLPAEQIVPPETFPELRKAVDEIRAGKDVALETLNLRRDGTPFPIRLSATALMAAERGNVILAVEDITAEKSRRSEEEAIAEERRRIAHEIHDGLAQGLASVRLRVGLLHRLAEDDPERLHAELDELQDILREGIRDVRRFIFALRPVDLDELGFFPALHQFVDDFGEQNQVYVDLQVSGPEDRLPSQLEPVLFRIIQEMLNNVAKHARADTVWIELDLQPTDCVRLMVRDNGVGFDLTTLDEAVRHGHMGLKHLRERVESLEGTLSLESQPGKGTVVEVALPV